LDSDAIPFEEQGLLDVARNKVGEKSGQVWMKLVW
jgi:hypothetical protein